MKNFKVLLASLVLLFSFCGCLSFAQPVLAANPVCPAGTNGEFCKASNTSDLNKVIKSVVNVLLFLIGSVSVVVIIISGFRMVVSGGNSDSVSKARNSILYAAIGIVVSLMAYAIVNFVLNQIK